jgi:hypothetical protein
VSIDTHELVKELISVGFSEPQAEALDVGRMSGA